MVRIIINSENGRGGQQAQFDLPNHNGSGFHVGDTIDDEIFENLGPVTIVSRAHVPQARLLIVYCEGSHFLQKFLVDNYPNINGMPNSAQIPPQDWVHLS